MKKIEITDSWLKGLSNNLANLKFFYTNINPRVSIELIKWACRSSWMVVNSPSGFTMRAPDGSAALELIAGAAQEEAYTRFVAFWLKYYHSPTKYGTNDFLWAFMNFLLGTNNTISDSIRKLVLEHHHAFLYNTNVYVGSLDSSLKIVHPDADRSSDNPYLKLPISYSDNPVVTWMRNIDTTYPDKWGHFLKDAREMPIQLVIDRLTFCKGYTLTPEIIDRIVDSTYKQHPSHMVTDPHQVLHCTGDCIPIGHASVQELKTVLRWHYTSVASDELVWSLLLLNKYDAASPIPTKNVQELFKLYLFHENEYDTAARLILDYSIVVDDPSIIVNMSINDAPMNSNLLKTLGISLKEIAASIFEDIEEDIVTFDEWCQYVTRFPHKMRFRIQTKIQQMREQLPLVKSIDGHVVVVYAADDKIECLQIDLLPGADTLEKLDIVIKTLIARRLHNNSRIYSMISKLLMDKNQVTLREDILHVNDKEYSLKGMSSVEQANYILHIAELSEEQKIDALRLI